MMQGLFQNPMLFQQNPTYISQSTASPYTSAYPSMQGTGYIPNMSSGSSGYPTIQQDIINQLNSNIYNQNQIYNKSSSPSRQQETQQKLQQNTEKKQNNITPKDKESS